MLEQGFILLGALLILGAIISVVFYAMRRMRKAGERSFAPAATKGATVAQPPQAQAKSTAVVAAMKRFAARNEFALVQPIAIQEGRASTDLDAVLVGWFGVLGVKCIGYGGTIYGSEGDAEWTQIQNGERRHFANPQTQAEQSARALRGRLLAQGLRNVPVECVFVFTNKKAQLALPRSIQPLLAKDFAAFLKQARFEKDNKVEVAPVAKALQG